MLKAKCTICTEQFDNEAPLSACHCGHVFHEACLSTWTRSRRTCPHCRAPVSESTLVKRLFFDDDAIPAPSSTCTSSSKPTGDEHERKEKKMLEQIDELKALLKHRDEEIRVKNKQVNSVMNKTSSIFFHFFRQGFLLLLFEENHPTDRQRQANRLAEEAKRVSEIVLEWNDEGVWLMNLTLFVLKGCSRRHFSPAKNALRRYHKV